MPMILPMDPTETALDAALARFTKTSSCPDYVRKAYPGWRAHVTSRPDPLDIFKPTPEPTTPPAPPVPPKATSPAAALNIGLGPGQNRFKVQVAPNGAPRFVEHTLDELAAGYTEAPYFTLTPAGDVQFWARLDAPTTSGTKYPRSELREMNADGSQAAWDSGKGTHILEGRTRITHLPPNKPDVVVAQLHNGNRDRVALRTQKFSDGTTKLVFRINGTSKVEGLEHLERNYTVGMAFSWRIEVVDGVVRLYYQDFTKPVYESARGVITESPTTCYFKAGAYAQSNPTTDPPQEWVSAEIAAGSLRCLHL